MSLLQPSSTFLESQDSLSFVHVDAIAGCCNLQFTVDSGRYQQHFLQHFRPLLDATAIFQCYQFAFLPSTTWCPSPKVTSSWLELTPADESGPRRSKRFLDLPKQQYLSANEPTTSESYKGMRRLNSYIYMLPEVGYMILLIRQKHVFVASPYNVKMAESCAETEGAWF